MRTGRPPSKRHAVIQPINEPYRLIPLTRNQTAIVDIADFEWLARSNWYAYWDRERNKFYAKRRIGSPGNKRNISMHRLILKCPVEDKVDHVNGNGLDNRRENLRIANHTQNMQNQSIRQDSTSGFRGVSWERRRNKWRAYISYNRRLKHLGEFSSKEEAARAYDVAARIYHGEFARLNFSSTT